MKIIFFTLFFLVSCGLGTNECKIDTIETILTDSDRGTYIHYVLLEDYHKDCLDSTSILQIAQNYIDTLSVGKPLTSINFYSSNEGFIQNSVSQKMREINKNCICGISFDLNGIPKMFAFYDDNGKLIYWGKDWQPLGW